MDWQRHYHFYVSSICEKSRYSFLKLHIELEVHDCLVLQRIKAIFVKAVSRNHYLKFPLL